MADTQLLSRIRFRAPTGQLASEGLVALADFEHGLISLSGIEVRRARDRGLSISFAPARLLDGRLGCSARPTSDAARRAIEAEVLAAAAREGWLR